MSGTSNPSLQRKSAARLAAVQCLYMLAMTGETRTPAQCVAALKARLKDNRQEQKLLVGDAVEPNYALTQALLEGVVEHREEIDHRLDGALSGGWKRERMSRLLVAILQCSIFELCLGREIKPAVVIDEYTRLSRHFFAEAEAGFVHGALHRIAEQYG